MELIRERCCCFTGHRLLSVAERADLRVLLREEIERLIEEGFTTFLSGGALGFDTLAAQEVLRLRAERLGQVALVLVLPCLGQESRWPAQDAALYHEILRSADEVIYTGDVYERGCMFVRNRYLVNRSSVCLCFLRENAARGGTAYTVRYAKKQGIEIVNLAEHLQNGKDPASVSRGRENKGGTEMDQKLLSEIIECPSPSGREDALQRYLYAHYKNDFECFATEEQGTLTAIHNAQAPFRVMIAAHADEISLIVSGYNGDGSLQVMQNGGVRPKLYVGAKVRVLAPGGVIYGAVGTNDGLQKKEDVKAKDLFIDIGCSTREEAEEAVPKGSYVVHDTDVRPLLHGRFSGRAFDDRIGVYVAFEAAKKAAKAGTKAAILCTATTGEETTGRGAFSAASKLKPNCCVSVDVTYSTDYQGAESSGDVSLGKGGAICRGSIPNVRLNALLAECAKELDLPVQYEVFPGRTGTDSDTMLRTLEGVPQVLFSIPLRYMHSPVEVLDEKDVDSMVDVLALFLQKLDESYDLNPFALD